MPTTLALVPAASSPIQFPAPATDGDFNAVVTPPPPITGGATGNSTGTDELVLTGVTGTIEIGAEIAEEPGVTITGQVDGDTGSDGTYTTSAPTTLTDEALTFSYQPAAPSLPIPPPGWSPPIVVNPATVIPGEPREKIGGNNPYVLALPTFRGPPLIPVGTTFNTSAVPPFDGTQPPANNAHPLPPMLVFNRAPPFPAYPT